ncbi:uncharacterized protein ZBAI_08046 [Zygosaccharomyces bailii ISA1307]|nr:uncharacterized protein ZBAI_08046 [Zygosaccharomyces bailii ISA1307]
MPRYERRRQRRTHCQGSQAFKDIAFLEDNGTWPLFRKPCIRNSVFYLAQDNWRDIDAYCPLFTGVCDESHSNGTRTAADIEDQSVSLTYGSKKAASDSAVRVCWVAKVLLQYPWLL